MTYCISDIHGDYAKYRRMLKKLRFCDCDTLYVLGDVVDRGPEPVKILLDMMKRPNVIPLLGNHEYMAAVCLRFLVKPVTEESIASLSDDALESLCNWQLQGGVSTLEEFRRLSPAKRGEVLEYLQEFILYEEISVNGRRYLLVHAGPADFSPDRPLEDYDLHEMLWTRLDYEKVYYKDRVLVSGHTPVSHIPGNVRPHSIYRANNHIAIDCGCGGGGPLGAICLGAGEEIYVE